MTRQPGYLVRWKGKESGPHTTSEIKELLDIGEFGMMHEVYFEGEWITLRRFLESPEVRPLKQESNSPTLPTPASPALPGVSIPAPVAESKTEEEQENDAEEEEEEGEPNPIFGYILIALGYLTSLAALLVYPQYVGFAGLMLGAVNAASQRYLHGSIQMALALICGYVGMQYTALLGRL